MSVLSDFSTYYKWLTTTKLSMEELSKIIGQCEKGMGNHKKWRVIIDGNDQKVEFIDLILRERVNGNGNGGNGNGHVGQPNGNGSGAENPAHVLR